MNTNIADATPTSREWIRILIESVPFERSITALILLNAVTLGLEASSLVTAWLGDLLHGFDRLVLAVFVVELLLRGFVHRGQFIRDPGACLTCWSWESL